MELQFAYKSTTTKAGGFKNRTLLSSKSRVNLYLPRLKISKILHKFNYPKTKL